MAPLSEVFWMTALEVVVEVVIAKIDVALRIVKVPQDLAAEDWPKELVRCITCLVPILDALGVLLQSIDGLVEPMQEHFALRLIPSRLRLLTLLLPLALFVFLLLHLFLGADLHRLLHPLLLLLLLFLLFEVFLCLVLSLADLRLLLFYLHLLLEQGGLLAQLGFFECFLCSLEFLVGSCDSRIFFESIRRATARSKPRLCQLFRPFCSGVL